MPDSSSLPLRDIHLPPSVGWWPPAPGWWLTPLLILLLGAMAWWLYRRYKRRAIWTRQARIEFSVIEQEYHQHQDGRKLIQSLSALIRRSAMSHLGRSGIAGLSGNDWLQFLDSVMGRKHFEGEYGQLLAEGAWHPELSITQAQAEALLRLTRDWLKQLPHYQGKRP